MAQIEQKLAKALMSTLQVHEQGESVFTCLCLSSDSHVPHNISMLCIQNGINHE